VPAIDLAVTVTNRFSELAGKVVDGDGSQVPDCLVLAFPTDPQLWADYGLSSLRIRQVRVNGTSGFRIRGLPDGDYYVVAIDSSKQGEWTALDFLRRVAPLGTRLSIRASQSVQVDLTLRRFR
jgi:hypothetical protein